MSWLVLAVVLGLALSNGANDNFKGVATIYGSGSASYRVSLAWATVTTLAGSLLSLVVAAGLVKVFSGRGLVPHALASSPAYLGAVALGAALTVVLATGLGLPVSTTHSLIGALVGAGFVGAGSAVDLGQLGQSFLLPLALSPVLAVAVASLLYPVATRLRRATGLMRETCVCVGEEWIPVAAGRGLLAVSAAPQLTLTAATTERCRDRYQGRMLGISAQHGLDLSHFVSAGIVSFARGLNDTPKLVALALASTLVSKSAGVPLVALLIAIGGVLGARRVAETMSNKVNTSLSPGAGLIANLTSAVLVIGASRYSLPVSTTYVTNGALFGIGAVTGSARWTTISSIVLGWLVTLPLAAVFGAAAYAVLQGLS